MIIPSISKLLRRKSRNKFTGWLRPYYNATIGGESVMIRYLDDPDVPCFAEGWTKADKNRYHQERAPGSLKKYVFNPNSWVYDFRDSLTAVSVANEWPFPGNSVPNEGWGSKRGVTLVTPRHVLCSHGGLGVGTESYPTKFRFVGTDGETYDRIAIGVRVGISSTNPVIVNGVPVQNDSTIITLNEDLPPEVIPVRCIPNHYKFGNSYANWDTLFVSQSIEIDSPNPTTFGEQLQFYPLDRDFPVSHYPRRHRSMCGTVSSSNVKVGYRVWPGDSGMPLFYGYGTELLFAGFVPGGGGSGADNFPKVFNGVKITWEDLTNQMIIDSDLNAGISPTGYTITLANEIPDLLPD